jgi:hypothetical protein
MNEIIKCFTQTQLANALDIPQGIIAMAVKRGNLFKEGKTINIDKEINKLWLERQIAQGKTFNINRIYQKPDKTIIKETYKKEEVNAPSTKKTTEKTPTEKNGLVELEIRKKELDIDRLQKTIRLDEIRIHKLEGQLLPYDSTANIFLYAVETFRASFLQEVKSIANIFVQRLGGEQKHFIELQKELSLKIEEIQAQAKEDIISGLEGIVDEYKEVRSRGERK